MKPDYRYRCEVIRVVDGDTLVLDIDLGLRIHTTAMIRLAGINTPEIRGPEREEGLKATEAVHKFLDDSTELVCTTYKDKTGKYGRWIVNVFGKDKLDDKWYWLNEYLVDNGFAKRVEY